MLLVYSQFFYDSKKIPLISPLLINYKFVADIKTKQTYLKNPSPKNVLFWKTIVFFQQVSFGEIPKIIRSLDINKEYGHDDISIRMIRICDISLVRPLSLLFKKSFDNSYFLKLQKKFNIMPVHKKKRNKIWKTIAPFHCSLFSVKYLNKQCLIKCTLSFKTNIF